ncbi:MAG: metalloprotease TldD [Gammaproteobacteria bacterium]|nr:metalloprotease TldD [Gammaproteobacteria bacterium]
MQQNLKIAVQTLLHESGLDISILKQTLHTMMQRQLDYADLYFQFQQSESWALEDGIVKEANFHIHRGVGIRAIRGEKTGFAYSDVITPEALKQAAITACGIADGKQNVTIGDKPLHQFAPLYMAQDPLAGLSQADKVALLQSADREARKLDHRVKQVMASISGSYEIILIAASDGTLSADVRPLVRFNVTVIVEDKGKREQGFSGGGGRGDYQMFIDNDHWMSFVKEAVRLATLNIDASDAPAGTMDVVLGSGWPGVLLHEAIGHGLEGDFNRKQTSSFSQLMGKQVASDLCTIVDDGTLGGRRGSLNVDDEGTQTQCTVLIEDGILKNYMMDKLNARLMGVNSTGNGRRESYAHIPMPRMTNTYMLPGKHNPQEIIASVKKGLYAVNFGGGQVDITTGKFVFVTNEAYLIENGKITKPVKGATLIGDGPTALKHVTMVGNDLALDPGVGVCGKEGQSLPVGVGQPTLRINGLTVGGTGT